MAYRGKGERSPRRQVGGGMAAMPPSTPLGIQYPSWHPLGNLLPWNVPRARGRICLSFHSKTLEGNNNFCFHGGNCKEMFLQAFRIHFKGIKTSLLVSKRKPEVLFLGPLMLSEAHQKVRKVHCFLGPQKRRQEEVPTGGEIAACSLSPDHYWYQVCHWF